MINAEGSTEDQIREREAEFLQIAEDGDGAAALPEKSSGISPHDAGTQDRVRPPKARST